MNNHAVRTKDFRYIRYEDGTEELYNHQNDPNEWTNLAGDKAHSKTIARIRKLLPNVASQGCNGLRQTRSGSGSGS